MKIRLFSILAALAAGLAAVSIAAASYGPSVSFSSPRANAKTGSTVTFAVKLSGFKLSAKGVGMKPKAGQGHLHFSMDDGRYDRPRYSGANGKLAVTLGVAGMYSPSVTPQITYSHLPKGKHTLVVRLAKNNHENAGARASFTFTVR